MIHQYSSFGRRSCRSSATSRPAPHDSRLRAGHSGVGKGEPLPGIVTLNEVKGAMPIMAPFPLATLGVRVTHVTRSSSHVEADLSRGRRPTIATAAEEGGERESGAREVNGVPGHDHLHEGVYVLTLYAEASEVPGAFRRSNGLMTSSCAADSRLRRPWACIGSLQPEQSRVTLARRPNYWFPPPPCRWGSHWLWAGKSFEGTKILARNGSRRGVTECYTRRIRPTAGAAQMRRLSPPIHPLLAPAAASYCAVSEAPFQPNHRKANV